MPYPQDLEGKYIRYAIDSGGTKTAAHDALLVDGLLGGQTSAASVPVYATPPPVIGGHRPSAGPTLGGHRAPTGGQAVNTGVNWNFTFLKYVAGAVTTAPLGTGVLTGPMTGCYLCTYTQNGVRKLAHIGTANAPNSVASVDAKNAWSAFVSLPGVSNVVGASPFDYFNQAEINAAFAGTPPMVAGYFDPAGTGYALLLKPIPANASPIVPAAAVLEVMGVKPMSMQAWSTIAALRTFQLQPVGEPKPAVKGAFKLPHR